MSSIGYREPVEELSEESRNMHRTIASLTEEPEAVDGCNRRVDACWDEEKEHESILLQSIRRRDPEFSWQLADYLFTERSFAYDLGLQSCCNENRAAFNRSTIV